MSAPVIVTIRPGVAFEPGAAASWRRLEAAAGRLIDVNSSYRNYSEQLAAYNAYQAYAAGTGPWAPFALHPDKSMHCRGLAVDTDDQTLMKGLPDHGWRQTALAIGEPWHFDYLATLDQHQGEPAGGGAVPLPLPSRKKGRDMILLKGQDSASGTTTILVVAAPGLWDRYALSFEAQLTEQFGKPVALTKPQMAEKESVYRRSSATATVQQIADAVNDEAAERLKA